MTVVQAFDGIIGALAHDPSGWPMRADSPELLPMLLTR